MEFRVGIEAQCYGDVAEDGGLLLAALEELAEGLSPSVGLREQDRMLAAVLTIDAADAIDAYTEAIELWLSAWQQAFPEQPPTRRLAVTSVPVNAGVGA